MSAQDFRRNAREALKGRWRFAVIAAFIASILGVSSTPSFSFGFGSTSTEGTGEESEFQFSEIEPAMVKFLIIVGSIALAIGLAVAIAYFIVSSVATLGYAKLNLAIVDKKEASIRDLLFYFKDWKIAAKTQFLRMLYIFLWSLLLIIPGIIASYSYAIVPYLLAEFPEISATDAIKTSKKLMNGNKVRLFYLDVSFIGWYILCILSLGIGFLWLNPYISAAKADFYREISATRPVPENPYFDDGFAETNNNDFEF